MKTTEKIDKYIKEAPIRIDPKKKKAFDDYKKSQKEAEDAMKVIKTEMKNHQNRFFQQSTLNMAYVQQMEQVVYELQKIRLQLK